MAIVKTLIVKGVARFLTDAYMSTIRSGIWNGSTIQVGYGGTGVTSAKGDLYTPVFLSSSGIAPCTVAIPHNTKDFKINGTTYSIFTTYTGTAPTIFAPTALAGTGGYILATNSAKTGLEWVAANNHTHSQYVLLDSGTNEQVIKSSISSLGDGVISLWRATSGGYPMIGFHSGTTKTKWGMLGFSAANTPIFRNTSNTDYLLAHAGNTVNDNITVNWNSETTIATIAGIPIKIKIPANPDRRKAFHGTCTTAAATAAKVVTLSDATGWVLVAGTIIGVKFTNDNTASSVTLNVNNSGAKSIFYDNAVYTGTSKDVCGKTNRITYYMYDGTNWAWLGSGYVINTTYSAGTAALIQAGTDTANRVWQAKILQDEFVSKRGDTMTGNLILNGTTCITSNTITDAAGYIMLGYNSGNILGAFGDGTTATIPTYIRSTGNNLYHRKGKDSSHTDHLIADAGNIVNDNISVSWNTETTIATIAGVPIKIKIPTNPNTWRNIYTGGTSRVGTGTNTKAMNFASSNLDITYLAAGTATGQSGNANYFTIGIEAKDWTGATSSAAGIAGYMPGAAVADRTKFLRGDGSWVALSLTDHTHSVKINGSTKTITASGETAVDLGSYLPLSGGTLTGPLGKSNNYLIKPVADFKATSSTYTGCITITLPAGIANTMVSMWIDVFNWSINKSFSVYCGGYTYNDSTWVHAPFALVLGARHRVRFGHNGTNFVIYIGEIDSTWSYPQIAVHNVTLGHSPNYANWYKNWTISFETSVSNVTADITRYAIKSDDISDKSATIGTSLTTIATIGGTDIKAKIPSVTAQAIELASVEKTLAVSTWTDMAAINGYTGTYAIQINSGNVYASGVFTACGGTDSVIDEIPLHVADKGTNTWRPYARISAGQLLMTTNEATGTARTYTIKILKLI